MKDPDMTSLSKHRFRACFLFVFFLSLLVPKILYSKDNTPKEYQSGKLLDISKVVHKVTTYKTVRNKDGSSTTTPTTDDENIYYLSVQLGDMIYVGRWKPMWSFSKVSDWIIGDPIDLRLNKNDLFLKKPNGKELKTKIEKRIRASEFKPSTKP